MNFFKYFIFGLCLVGPFGVTQAYTYATHYGSGHGGYLSGYHHGGGYSGYSGAWRGSSSHYIRNFNRSGGSSGYFGVPTGTSVGSTSYISRKHRAAYRRQIEAFRLEQIRLDNLPPPCGTYGRAPVTCPVSRWSANAN